MKEEIRQLLLEEIIGKKVFLAKFAILCELCRENIEEDREFVFIGDKKKLCMNCQRTFINEIENT